MKKNHKKILAIIFFPFFFMIHLLLQNDLFYINAYINSFQIIQPICLLVNNHNGSEVEMNEPDSRSITLSGFIIQTNIKLTLYSTFVLHASPNSS